MNHEDKMLRARLRMQKWCPFTYMLITHMNITADEAIPSACVNGNGVMKYNAEWIESLSIAQTTGVLAHEALHVALHHPLRVGSRNHMIWNIAIDMKCNDIIEDIRVESNNKVLLPHTTIKVESHTATWQNINVSTIDKKTSEQIYDDLCSNDKVKKMMERMAKTGNELGKAGQGMGKGDKEYEGFDKHELGNPTDRPQKEIEDKWKEIAAQAKQAHQQRGTLPGGLGWVLDKLMESQVRWFDVLQRYITSEIPVDYTFLRPSRKSLAIGAYMPAIVRESLDVVIHIDSSGSVCDKTLAVFLSEVEAIGNSFAYIDMTVIICDAKVQDVFPLRGADARRPSEHVKIGGRGGTSHVPVQKWIEDNKPMARIVVSLTDGYTEFPEHYTGSWIWVLPPGSCDDENIPYGDIVRMD